MSSIQGLRNSMVLTSNTASVSPTGSQCGLVLISLRAFFSHSANRGSSGPFLCHSCFPFMWFPTQFINQASLSVTKIAPAVPYNHTYFLFPLPCGNKVAVSYTCPMRRSQGAHSQYFHVMAVVVIAIMVS